MTLIHHDPRAKSRANTEMVSGEKGATGKDYAFPIVEIEELYRTCVEVAPKDDNWREFEAGEAEHVKIRGDWYILQSVIDGKTVICTPLSNTPKGD